MTFNEESQIQQFALLGASSMNIGDELQAIAARRFLPEVSAIVHREQTHLVKSPSDIILNGWWMWKSKNFPPSEHLNPLLISMHLRKEARESFLTPSAKKFFVDHGPVGARDLETRDFLLSEGIPAYFSGCLTLTIPPNPKIVKRDYILGIDISGRHAKMLEKISGLRVFVVNPIMNPALEYSERLKLGESYLSFIQAARVVVSPRLHAILPAVALGTPAIRVVESKDSMDNSGRFSGLSSLAHSAKENDIEEFFSKFNFLTPTPNPNHDKFLEISQSLERACMNFTGFSQPGSPVPDFEEASFTILQLHRKRIGNLSLATWHFSTRKLLELIFKRVFLRQTKHDLRLS